MGNKHGEFYLVFILVLLIFPGLSGCETRQQRAADNHHRGIYEREEERAALEIRADEEEGDDAPRAQMTPGEVSRQEGDEADSYPRASWETGYPGVVPPRAQPEDSLSVTAHHSIPEQEPQGPVEEVLADEEGSAEDVSAGEGASPEVEGPSEPAPGRTSPPAQSSAAGPAPGEDEESEDEVPRPGTRAYLAWLQEQEKDDDNRGAWVFDDDDWWELEVGVPRFRHHAIIRK